MVGKGWTWIGSDGAVSTTFRTSQNLQRAMQGMVGFRPESGSGLLFEALYDEWLRMHHSADRQVTSLSLQIYIINNTSANTCFILKGLISAAQRARRMMLYIIQYIR